MSIDSNHHSSEVDESPNTNDTNSMVSDGSGEAGVGIVSGTSETPSTSNNRRRAQPLLNRKIIPASFITGCEGQHLCSIILAQAKCEGYHLTIGFGKRIGWLKEGEKSFFEPGGILQDYKITRFDLIRKKLAQAETQAFALYNAKQHNSDESNPTEDLPTYVKHIFDYFRLEGRKSNKQARSHSTS